MVIVSIFLPKTNNFFFKMLIDDRYNNYCNLATFSLGFTFIIYLSCIASIDTYGKCAYLEKLLPNLFLNEIFDL